MMDLRSVSEKKAGLVYAGISFVISLAIMPFLHTYVTREGPEGILHSFIHFPAAILGELFIERGILDPIFAVVGLVFVFGIFFAFGALGRNLYTDSRPGFHVLAWIAWLSPHLGGFLLFLLFFLAELG